MKILNSIPVIFQYINTDIGVFRVNMGEKEPIEIFDHCEWKVANVGFDISSDDYFEVLDYVKNL